MQPLELEKGGPIRFQPTHCMRQPSHCMHSVHKMRPIARDGLSWSDCWSLTHIREPCKMAEPIQMPFGWAIWMGPMSHVLDGVNVLLIHSQPQGVTCRRCGLLPSYFGHLFMFILHCSYFTCNGACLLLLCLDISSVPNKMIGLEENI